MNRLGKSFLEISKWVNGEYNFILRLLCKFEDELGEELIIIFVVFVDVFIENLV